MKITIGYIGVITVTIEKNTWDDTASITGEDSAHEVAGFEYDAPTLLAAWRRAAREIAKRGGVVLHAAPAANRRFFVTAECPDIIPCAQGCSAPFNEAAKQFDKKMYEVEDGLCNGWAKSNSHLAVSYTDNDGYQVRIRLREENEYLAEMHCKYGE